MYNLFIEFGHIFAQILNISIAAGWFALAVILLRLLLKKAPKWISCLLWGLVAIRLIMPFSIESALSLIPSAEALPVSNIYNSPSSISGNINYRNVDSGSEIFDAFVGAALRETTSPAVVRDGFGICACLWILGVAAMLIYTAVSYNRINRRVSEAAPLKDNVWMCDRIDTPFIFGLIKPRIYIPSDMNEQDKEFVIAHEKAHLSRRDHLWKPLGFLLLTVYWFNPVLWFAYTLLCRDIELACDEKVIKEMGAEIKKPYSNALINCSVPRKAIAACPLAFGETGVKGRIKSVLNYKKPAFWVIVVAIIASVVLAVCFLTNPFDDSAIFNAKYQTGECLYCDVVPEKKATESNGLIFGINSTGGVYKDYGNGEGEYIGELKKSDFSAKELNKLLKEQSKGRVYLGNINKVYEISDESGKKEYVLFQKKNGNLVIVLFFTNGGVMSVFELVEMSGSDTYHKKNNPLNDELSVFVDMHIADHFRSEDSYRFFPCIDTEILGVRRFLNKTTVYMWVLYEEYSNNNGLTLECGAHIPTVITVKKENGGYRLVEYWEPRDGSLYADDICDKFPWYLEGQATDSQRYIHNQKARNKKSAMDYFKIDYAVIEGIDEYNSTNSGKPLTLENVIELSRKGDALTWSDFEEFRYIETGSGLYIRQYEIDELFTLLIGGSGIDSEPMYIYLNASDAFDYSVDIRKTDVQKFVDEHKNNPVVKNLSASWNCSPVGYNERTYEEFFRISGLPEKAYYSYIRSLPALKIEDEAELQSLMQKMSGIMNFDSSYSDSPSFNETCKEYNNEFFEKSTLVLVYTTVSTTAHRHTVEYISESEGILTVGISEIDPEAGDTAMEGWLVAISLSKEDTADITRIDAHISSTQFPNRGTANAEIKRVYAFKESEEIIKPVVTLYDNGMFQFTFSAVSSYIGFGEYILENDKLTLNTDDGKFTYVFDVVNDNLVFDAENSSEMLWFSDMYDGCIFE